MQTNVSWLSLFFCPFVSVYVECELVFVSFVFIVFIIARASSIDAADEDANDHDDVVGGCGCGSGGDNGGDLGDRILFTCSV